MSAVQPDDGVVKVTLNTVYQTQLQTGVTLAEIQGTLLLLTNNMTHVIDVGKDHESRIRDLEKEKITESDRQALEGRIAKLEQNSISRSGVYAMMGVGLTAAGTLATIIALVTQR